MNSMIFYSTHNNFTPMSLETKNGSNGTTTLPAYSGFLFLVGSSVFYGSNYLPVKQFETGDGMFFQLILCMAIWSVGVIVNIARNFPKFYALPMLGGFLWATGNIQVVIIIKTIGIGLGMLVWGGTSLIVGWATARFGWLGLDAQVPTKVTLNYIAVALILLSTLFYLFIKPETKNVKQSELNTNSTEVLTEYDNEDQLLNPNNQSEESFFDKLNPNKKRILGISLAVISGILYSQANTPILYIRDHRNDEKYLNASTNTMDYLLSQYTGIFLSSMFYFAIYCAFKKNKPVLYPKVILPGLISGWMWGIANIFYFLSLNAISQAVSFPISNAGPAIVSNLWGIFLYKEIRGFKNFAFLLGGFLLSILGSVLCGLSF